MVVRPGHEGSNGALRGYEGRQSLVSKGAVAVHRTVGVQADAAPSRSGELDYSANGGPRHTAVSRRPTTPRAMAP